MTALLRPITAADHHQVLAWNAAHVELLSPLDEERLITLLGWTDRACVITHDGRDVGFVLTFAAGTAYDSENYRWFTLRYPSFYYLDRVVVEPSVRRAGVGTRVYDELEPPGRMAEQLVMAAMRQRNPAVDERWIDAFAGRHVADPAADEKSSRVPVELVLAVRTSSRLP